MISNNQPQPEAMRIPPHSLEAEQSFIGSLIIEGSTQRNREAMDLVSAEMFYQQRHSEIYRVILGLKEIDLLTVSDKIKNSEFDDSDFGYLANLAKNTPSTSNVASYAKIIKDRWVKRELLSVGHQLLEEGYSGTATDELIESITTSLSKIDTSTGYKPKVLSEGISGWLNRMQAKADGKEEVVGLKTGIAGLDKALGGIKEDWLITLAGRSGMGKTLISQLIATGMSSHYPVQFFSMEMSGGELEDRFMSLMAGISTKSTATGLMTDYEVSRAAQTIERFEAGENVIMYDETPGLNVNQIATRSREAKRLANGKLSLIVVDYLGLIDMPKAEREDIQIGMVTKSLKRLAKEIRTPILLLAQANRGMDNVDRPQNSNLHGSMKIEADSDLVMFVHRKETRDPATAFKGVTQIINTKNRHGPEFKDVYLRRNDETGKYETLSIETVAMLDQEDQSKNAPPERSQRKFSQTYRSKP